jgi:hypothetical protein
MAASSFAPLAANKLLMPNMSFNLPLENSAEIGACGCNFRKVKQHTLNFSATRPINVSTAMQCLQKQDGRSTLAAIMPDVKH